MVCIRRSNKKWKISMIFLIFFSMPVTASAWPTDDQWHVVVNQTGNFSDPFDDYGGPKEDVEIVGNDTYPVSYIFNDGTYLYFRMRILDDPVPNGNYFIRLKNGSHFYFPPSFLNIFHPITIFF